MADRDEQSVADAILWRAVDAARAWPLPAAVFAAVVVAAAVAPWWATVVVAGAAAAVIWWTWPRIRMRGRRVRARREFEGDRGSEGHAKAMGLVARSGESVRLLNFSRGTEATLLTLELVPGVGDRELTAALPHLAIWQQGVRATVDEERTARIARPGVRVVRVVLRDALAAPRTAAWVEPPEPDRWSK